MQKKIIKKRWALIIGVLIICNIYISKKLIHTYPVIDLYSYQDIEDEINVANKKTLVLFDVDDTLISTRDVFTRGSYYPWSLMILLFFRFPYYLNNMAFEEAHSIALSQANRELIDPYAINVINAFKNKNAVILGLTKIETGKFGVLSDVAKWRYNMLSDIGIEFTKKFENKKFITLHSYRGYYPELYNGIICTNRQPKDEVLEAFFDYVNTKPSKIIFFDDKKSNLQKIGAVCKKYNISCRLYHVRIIDSWSHDWNFFQILQQIKILSNKKQWIMAKDLP